MILFLTICLFYFIDKNLFATIVNDNESIDRIFENDEIEHIRNMERGISCHIYCFDKKKFYESNLKSEFIDYLDKTKSQITDRSIMTFISIILYDIPDIKIVKTEVQKILQFIISDKEFIEYPNNNKNLYSLEINKMDLKRDKKDFFNKLPDFHQSTPFLNEKLTHNVFNIFLLEDIGKNFPLKEVLRKEIEKFFYRQSRIRKKDTMMKILIIEAINCPEYNFFSDLQSRLKNSSEILASVTSTCFISFGLVQNNVSYCQTKTLFRNVKKAEFPLIFNPFFYSNNESSLLLYKSMKGNNIDYNVKFASKYMMFGIWKYPDTNDTFNKLLYFLSYVPLENYFGIKIINKTSDRYSISFKIKISLYKKIIKETNKRIPETYKNIKQIIISKDENICATDVLINYSYETDIHSSIGFPLSNIERELIQENDYKKNLDAKKLINFIDFYESYMFGRSYFYFKDTYCKDLDFNSEFCFYQKEIWFKYLNLDQIYIILKNSINFQNDVDLRRKSETLKSIKTIEVFQFERDYTKNINPNILNNNKNKNILKGFESHHFFNIELCFYSNVQLIKFYKTKKYIDVNNFIKIDFGFNKNYFLFFREVPNNETDQITFYDINNINNEAKIFLTSSLKCLLCLDDNKEAEKYSLNFIKVIFKIAKRYLNDNLTVEKVLKTVLRERLHFLLPKIQGLMTEYLNLSDNIKTEITSNKVDAIKYLLNTSMVIIKRNYKNVLYEACVLSSLSNRVNKSSEILESLL